MANEADLEHVEPAKPIWIFLDEYGQIADFIAWAHHRFVTVNDDEGTKFLPSDTHKLVYFRPKRSYLNE